MMRRPLAALLLLAALAAGASDARAADLYVVVNGTTASGEPTPIGVRTTRDGQVLVRAWRILHPEALREAGLALDRGETLDFLDPQAAGRTPRQDALLRAAGLRPALISTPVPVPANALKEVELRLGKPGLYLVAVTQGARSAYVTALISDLGLLVKRDAGHLLAWAVHRTTGRPWPGAAVLVEGGGITWEGVTDADGLVLFAGRVPPTAAVRARAGEHLVLGRTQAWPSPDQGLRVYLHTHQPAYRPGERVEVRGIVRSVDGGVLALDPEVHEVGVRLLAPGEKLMGEAVAPVSAGMGTFAAGFDLPENAPTGDWAIVADVASREYEAPLVVAAYRKPSFEVVVSGKASRVLVGAPTRFDVEAAFYDGGRLANAAVTWQLLYQRVDRALFPADELVKLFFGSEREAYRPTTLATGQGTLDAQGRLAVPVAAPDGVASGWISLQATVQGPGRTAVVGTGRIAVSASPLVVDLRTDRHLYGPEDVARVRIRAERADGTPAASRAGVVTVALAPEPAPGESPEETWLHTLPFETDTGGEAVIDAPLGAAGRYTVQATLPRADDDPPGAPVFARVHVWAAGERATPGPVGSTLEVIADRDHYAVGDTARLLVLPAGGARPVLATVERDGLLDRRVLLPGEAPPLFDLALGEIHVPNVFVTFSSVDHGRLYTTTRVIRIPPRSRLLTTDVRPDAAEIRPGAASGVTIHVADADGRPVAGAEVDVAVVDEALFALHADPTAPMEAFFHPPRRNAVSTEALLAWQSVGWSKEPVAEGKSGGRPAASPSTPAESAPPGTREPADGADDAPPAPEPSPEMEEEVLDEADEDVEAGFTSGGGGRSRSVAKKLRVRRQAERVREDFRSAVFWEPALVTGADGRVRIDAVPYGDALTRWRITAHGLDASTRVGTGTANVRTKLDVAASVTLPRFLRAGDRASVPLVLRNLTGEDLDAEWKLEAGATSGGWIRSGTVDLGAHAVSVLEQAFQSHRPETVTFLASLATTAGGDAERRELPVLPRGIPKVVGRTLFARAGEATLELQIPENAEPGSTTCRISLEPGYVQALASALPYLLEYPYGCTEQTLSRFVPLVSAHEALTALNRPSAKHAGDLDAMIEAGVQRLLALRHPDGGFGWWERDATDPGMTALVVRGLSRLLAARPGHEAAQQLRDGAAAALAKLVQEGAPGLDVATRASVVLALASAGRLGDAVLLPGDSAAWRGLPPLPRALLLRAAVAEGRVDLVAVVRGLLDDEAHREDDRLWWSASADANPTRWQDDAIATTAEVLHALLEAGVRPEVLEGGARWLLEARVGGDRWRSTRDTASAVEFLAAYVRATGDLGAGRELVLSLGSEIVWQGRITADTAPDGVVTYDVPAGALTPGKTLRLTLACPAGSASAGVALRFHETGPAIAASEAGFRVARRFYRLQPQEQDGRVTYECTPVTETLPSGTVVECEVVLETDRPREYVMITSPHAGGFEPARETGFDVPGRTPATEARKDARDDRTMFFVARLPAGTHTFRHTLRATHAGSFTALPAMAELMYFPDVRGNSNGELWQITATGPVGEER